MTLWRFLRKLICGLSLGFHGKLNYFMRINRFLLKKKKKKKMDNRVCCPTTFALNRWLHNLSNGAFVTCKYRTFQSGMAGSFQWNLLHDSFGTEDSVQQAPHLEGEVKETIALSLGLRGSH